MKTITDLTTQKRKPDRINVFLNDQFAFGLSASLAAELVIGQQLTPADIEILKRKERVEKAKQNALKYVSLRPRSEYELRSHFRRKSFEESVIDDVVAYLIDLELLDDTAFANYWVEQRETFRPRSRFALSQELRQKGISREIIDEVVEQIEETDAARRAVEKKALHWSGLPEDTFKRKLAGYLQRRGFSYDIIRETIDEAWQALERN
jgi:regulatory protein